MTKTTAQKLRKKATGAALMAAAASAARASSKKKGSTKKAVKIVEAAEKKSGWLVPESSLQAKIGDMPVGRAIGSAVGSLFGEGGSNVGGWFGNLLHRGFRSLSGMGDYKLGIRQLKTHLGEHANGSIMLSQRLPLFRPSSGDGPGVLIWEERIATVYSSVQFKTTQFRINPGLPATFPWLSSVAGNYENWKCMGMMVQARSLLSESAQNSAGVVGEWGLATDINPYAAVPPDYSSFVMHSFSDTQRGTDPLLTGIECDPSKNPNTPWKAVSFPGDQSDKHFTDQGQVFLATQGYAADGVAVGSLWVTYKVAFNNPVANALANGATSFSFANSFTTVAGNACTIPAGLNPSSGGKLGGKWPAANSWLMPQIRGSYWMMIMWSVNGTMTASPSIASMSANIALHNSTGGGPGFFSGATWTGIPSWASITGQNAILWFSFDYSASNVVAQDFVFNPPVGGPGPGTVYAVQAWMFPREPALMLSTPRPLMSSDVEDMIRSSITRYLEHNYEEDDVEDDTTQYFVVGVTYTADGPTVQQWPYSGPIPPPVSAEQKKRDDLEAAVQSAMASRASAAAAPKDWRSIDENVRKSINRSLDTALARDSPFGVVGDFKRTDRAFRNALVAKTLGSRAVRATYGVDNSDSRRESFTEVALEADEQTLASPASAAVAAVVQAEPDLKAYVEKMEPTQRTAFLEKIKTYLPM